MKIIENWILNKANKIRNDRIERGWDLVSYFDEMLPGIRALCVKDLTNKNFVKYNEKHTEIFGNTVELIDSYNIDGDYQELWEYIGKNIGYYWD